VSDFFSRLLDRSTGAVAVPRPVVPPLFGPSPTPPEGSAEAAETTHAVSEAPVPALVTQPFAPPREIAIVRPPAQPVTDQPRAEPPVSYLYPANAAHAPALGFRLREPPCHSEDVRAALGARAQDRGAGRLVEALIATRPPVQQAPDIDVVRPITALLPTRARRSEPQNAESAMGGPVVTVTIGRIEVKAAQPAAPAPPSTPRKPAAVSLEEYLRPHRRKP
jgi:hypothetical protein